MNTEGKIIEIFEDKATVNVIRKGACGENCAACNSCKNSDISVMAYCDINVKVGDTVIISSNSGYIYLGLVILFLLPILLPLLTYFLLYKINKILLSVLVVFSLILSIFIIYRFSKSEIYLKRVTPVVVSVKNK